MKILVEKSPSQFRPINVEFTIESLEELNAIQALFYCSISVPAMLCKSKEEIRKREIIENFMQEISTKIHKKYYEV